MREGPVKRIVLAVLMLTILSAYLYLQIRGFRELRLPRETVGALSADESQAASLSQSPDSPQPAELPESGEGEAAPEPDTPYGKALVNAAKQGLPEPPDIDISSWEYTLVNGEHSIGRYAPEQLAYLNMTLADTEIRTAYDGNRQMVDLRIAEPLIAMCKGCKDAGLSVYLSSGYRDYDTQEQNFTRICRNNGCTDGKDANGHYITMPPGCSEHQLALCCDITDRYYETKTPEKVASRTIDWLLEHCAEYGFVQRFPSGKEDITGVMNETWHFRYVGVEAAVYMTENHLTLEEFLGLYGVE